MNRAGVGDVEDRWLGDGERDRAAESRQGRTMIYPTGPRRWVNFVETGGTSVSRLITRPIVTATLAISCNMADSLAVEAYEAVIGRYSRNWITSIARCKN